MRFRVSHLLVVMAVLAVHVALGVKYGFVGVFLAFVLAGGWGMFYFISQKQWANESKPRKKK
jgi:hypothetical protein